MTTTNEAQIDIRLVEDERTVEYAAAELKRCLELSLPVRCRILSGAPAPQEGKTAPGLLIGSSKGLAGTLAGTGPRLPSPGESDDVIHVDVTFSPAGAEGIVCGSNPRSTLIASYRLLHELGFRWVRPGDEGELVPPHTGIPAERFIVRESASYRHRGICIEGAVSREHVRDVVEWLPRVGLNAYFIQFREAYTFFERWYARRGNPLKRPEPFSAEDARSIVAELSEEIVKRGLDYHAVGHGWTCEPFGVPGLEWEPYEESIPDEVRRYFAEINGKRELFGRIPLNTNLCYSNPEVRRTMVDSIVEYAGDHPEVGYLHIWLADGSNNNCECESCRKLRPSDYYVMLLNEIDERFDTAGISTKLVFLIYVDLLWPPERERLRPSDRFTLMFAPITRSYSRPFTQGNSEASMKPYERNKLEFPASVGENLAYLNAWQPLFEGDSFDFDYHLMWDHYLDPGYMQVASVLHADLRDLKGIGINGYMSCQIQRATFPTGFCMYLLGAVLWDRTKRLEEVQTEYFAASFGQDGAACAEYLTQLSKLFDPQTLRGERNEPASEQADRFAAARELIDSFLPVIRRNTATEVKAHAASWRYLERHGEITKALADVLGDRALGKHDQAREKWAGLKQSLWTMEDELHRAFDLYFFTRVIGSRLLGEPRV